MQNKQTGGVFLRVWRKYISQRFFNKALFMFFCIALFAGMVLLYVLSNNLITIKTEQALDMSSQIVDTVDSYINGKLTAAQAIQQRLIQDHDNWNSICSFLEDPKYTLSADRYAQIRQSIAQTIYAVDSQFYGVFLYGHENKRVLRLSSNSDALDFVSVENWARESRVHDGKILSARNTQMKNNAFFMVALSGINDPDIFTQEIGVMGLTFHAMNVKQCYRNLEIYLKGPLLILDGNGALLFDSRAEYTMPKDFSFADINLKSSTRFDTSAFICNSRYNAQGDFYVVNLIPRMEVRRDVDVVRNSITLVIVIILLVALLLTFYVSRMFARRLKKLSDTMELVRGGQLTGLAADSHVDELGALHEEFLSVCQSLDDHIQREYIYQLRQKEMEVYALQAQIDPHFLYNTLEAIRMKLLLSGDQQLSRMIRVMSEVFRNIMKKDMVVSVREELMYLQSYLELYKFRLGDKLEYSFEIDERVYAYSTIKHILQPIVENCLLHGFKDITETETVGKILVAAWRDEGDIVYIVRDNGQGIAQEKLAEMERKLAADEAFQQSVGIYNVNSRLHIIYGDKYRLQIVSNTSGTEVLVRIKAMNQKELEEYVQGSAGGRRTDDSRGT